MKIMKKTKVKKIKNKKISKRKQLRNIEKQLPKSYRPITGWGYFWRAVLYAIPVIGWIFLLVNAIGAKNRNGRYFARSYFCGLLLALIATAVVVVLDLVADAGIFQAIKDLANDFLNALRPLI